MFNKQKKDAIELINDIITNAYEARNYDIVRLLTNVKNREGIIGKLAYSFIMICSVVSWYYIEIKYWLKDVKYYAKRWLCRFRR